MSDQDWLPYEAIHGPDNTISGTVIVWPELISHELGRSREIIVYLPPSLGHDGPGWVDGRRYPVLYFHDGQNVFDERTSFSGEWHADETLEQLAAEGYEAIAVAVPNGGDARFDEYGAWREPSPWHPNQPEVGGQADAYLSWLTGSVKSLIDRSFPTSTQREATGLVGSSMGGFVSLYGLINQPHVFGLAVVMSPSLRWADYRIVDMVSGGQLPPARIHLDIGAHEGSGLGVDDVRRLRDALIERGWAEGRDLSYVEDAEGRHQEAAWARRLPDALRFLLAPFRQAA